MSSKFNFTKESDFKEVFGDYATAYTEEERRLRWDDYKNMVGPHQSKIWNDCSETCTGCIHLDDVNSWCKDFGLPCTVNPVFGFKMIGMACRGIGYEAEQPELNLFEQV